MRIVEGNLTMLGNSKIDQKQTIYSVVEIGDNVLQKIYVPNALDNFLSRALNQEGTTKLYLHGKLLAGVELPNGKLYCYSNNIFWPLIIILLGIPAIPAFGIGLFVIWLGVRELKMILIGKSLQSRGGIPCSL